MINIIEETIIGAPVEKVYKFMCNFDVLYKDWHPKSHIFCQTLYGSIDKPGSIVHFLEILGWLPLYLPVQITKVIPNQILEAEGIFPLSLLKLGRGGFYFKSVSKNKTKFTAYVHAGYNGIFGNLLEKIIWSLVPKSLVLDHMREEGENIKKYLFLHKEF